MREISKIMMADGPRKSGRSKVKKSSYLEADFDYDFCDSDLRNIDNSISETTRVSSKRKSKQNQPSSSESKYFKEDGNIQQSKQCVSETNVSSGVDGSEEGVKEGGQEDSKEFMSEMDTSSLSCPLCGIMCRETELEAHIKEHRSKDSKLEGCFMCEICHKVYVDATSLNRHMKTHMGQRPHKCDQCDKSFTDSSSLKRHHKSHLDERPFVCDLCFKAFRDSCTFQRHQKTHMERARIFQCQQCDKSFAENQGLKRHERSHLGLKPFECNICGKSFAEVCSFRRHQKIHTGVKNFHCWRCKRSFLEKQSLVRHMKHVCGFGGYSDSESSLLLDESRDSFHSDLDKSDISHSTFDESIAKSQIRIKNVKGNLAKMTGIKDENPTSDYTAELKTAIDEGRVSKDSPSLGTLLKKDPNLIGSISEIVESIDSYEKMLDLCGDKGQNDLDAALTREAPTMPDNLVCFECGELLVDGDNFEKEGKIFASSFSSFRCINCEEEDLNTKVIHNSAGRDAHISKEPPQNQHGFLYTESTHPASNKASLNVANKKANFSLISGGNDFSESNNLHTPSLQTVKEININPSFYENLTNNVPQQECEAANTPSVFPCHLCSKVFATSAFLSQHLELHKKAAFKCMVCSKSFFNSVGLKRHMLTHSGEKPYACPNCNKRFRDNSNCYKHKKTCLSDPRVPVHSPKSAKSFETNMLSSLSHGIKPEGENNGTSNKNASEQHCRPDETGDHLSVRFNYDTGLSDENGKTYCDIQPASLSSKIDEDPDESNPVSCNNEDSNTDDEEKIDSLTVCFQNNADITIKEEIEDVHDGNMIDNSRDRLSSNMNDILSLNGAKPFSEVVNTSIDASISSTCGLCEKTFQDDKALEAHMNYHYGDPNVTCIECGKSFHDSFGLKRHLRTHEATRPFLCEYCGRGYCDNWSLKKHKSRGCLLNEVKVPADLLHPCPQCTRVFSEEADMAEHAKTHQGLLKYECDICFKKFSEVFNLKRHRRLHMAVCPGCDREFKDVQTLQQHQDTECNAGSQLSSKDEGFSCPECGRVYSTKAYLERHRKFHSGLKPHMCDICNKRFPEAFRLRRHMKVHTNKTQGFPKANIKVDPNEDAEVHHQSKIIKSEPFDSHQQEHSTDSNSLVKQEIEEHQTEFVCHICKKVFHKNYLLTRHMSVHSAERPFACAICGKSYKDISSLRRHEYVHNGIKGFICPICGKEFQYHDSLRRHMKGACGTTYHNNQLTTQMFESPSTMSDANIQSNNSLGNTLDSAENIKLSKLSTAAYSLRTLFSSYPNGSATYSGSHPLRSVSVSRWSCHKNRHCWLCDVRFESHQDLVKHARAHKHRKRFRCTQCFLRFKSKKYMKCHVSHHSLKTHDRRSLVDFRSLFAGSIKERPKSSIARAKLSWLALI